MSIQKNAVDGEMQKNKKEKYNYIMPKTKGIIAVIMFMSIMQSIVLLGVTSKKPLLATILIAVLISLGLIIRDFIRYKNIVHIKDL